MTYIFLEYYNIYSSYIIDAGPPAAPTNLIIRQNGINSTLVSWTAPSPAPNMGYRITIDSTDGTDATDSSATVTLQPGVHNISMRSLSRHYPSEIVGPVEVTVKGNEGE